MSVGKTAALAASREARLAALRRVADRWGLRIEETGPPRPGRGYQYRVTNADGDGLAPPLTREEVRVFLEGFAASFEMFDGEG